MSSIDSASSLFKRRFSSSSALSRRASVTSRPPYLDFHLSVSRSRSLGAGSEQQIIGVLREHEAGAKTEGSGFLSSSISFSVDGLYLKIG